MATVTASRPSVNGAGTADTTMSHPFTCNTCQVAFRNSDLQKGHMKSDWHRYNLKRRVATLPPISSEVFTEKVLQARAATTAEADRAGFERMCDVCQKTYYSENSYRNHIGSAKHRARAAALLSKSPAAAEDEVQSVMSSTFSLGEPAETKADLDSDAEEEFTEVIESLKKAGLQDRPSPVERPHNPHLPEADAKEADAVAPSGEQAPTSDVASSMTTTAPAPSLKSCLFCNYESPTVPLNATHMERIHGMFIPEKQYLVDLDGLLRALQQRIFELHECLACGKVKANSAAVQTHMRDKGHCRIPYTTEEEQLEIGEFYDFRSTYSDDEESSEDESMDDDEGHAHGGGGGGGARLGAKRPTKATNEDGDEIMADEGEEDGWETDTSASSLDTDDLHAVPAEQHYHQYERLDRHPHHSRDDPRRHLQRDGFHSHAHKHAHAVFYDEYEMHLPSGRSVGHRSLNRYYRQNLHSHPTPEERAHRLALEGAEVESAATAAMDVDVRDGGEAREHHRGHRGSRAVISRADGGLGMLGVTEQKKREVRKAEVRARKVANQAQKRNEWALNKQANHQKYYHYSLL